MLSGGHEVPSTDPEVSDVAVSDLDSDLEPDQLVPTYIKIKGKLFEIDPDAAEPRSRKQAKGGKGRNVATANTVQSPAVRKLLSQLQLLESDALFDEIEAGAQWPAKRAEVAQKMAMKRQEQTTMPATPKPSEATNSEPTPRKTPAWKKPAPEAPSDESNIEEDALLGDMFSAVPDEAPKTAESSTRETDPNVTLRDFGKQTGVTPRRVLEEALRARFVGRIRVEISS